MYANRSVLSRNLKAPIVSADLVDGDREFQTVRAAIENDLSANELMSGGCSEVTDPIFDHIPNTVARCFSPLRAK